MDICGLMRTTEQMVDIRHDNQQKTQVTAQPLP